MKSLLLMLAAAGLTSCTTPEKPAAPQGPVYGSMEVSMGTIQRHL